MSDRESEWSEWDVMSDALALAKERAAWASTWVAWWKTSHALAAKEAASEEGESKEGDAE